MRNATFRQLKTFVAVAERLSYSRAAEDLHISQPAVSEQIRQLEGHVGLRLFEKLGRRIFLTPAGQEMLRCSLDIIQDFTRAEEAMARFRNDERPQLRAGMITAGGYLFPHLLALFMERHPGVELDIAVQNREELLARVEDNATDIVVLIGVPSGSPLVSTAFAPHPFVIVAPRNHPLAGRRSIPLSALQDERFLVRERGSDTYQAMSHHLLRGFPAPPAMVEIKSTEAIKQSVIAGLGLSFLSAHTVGFEVQSGMLTVLDVAGFPVSDSWQVAHRADKVLSPIALAFKQFLLEEGPGQIARLSKFEHFAGLHDNVVDAGQFRRQMG